MKNKSIVEPLTRKIIDTYIKECIVFLQEDRHLTQESVTASLSVHYDVAHYNNGTFLGNETYFIMNGNHIFFIINCTTNKVYSDYFTHAEWLRVERELKFQYLSNV